MRRNLNPITKHRNELSLSQSQISKKINVSQALISFWESGRVKPKEEHLIMMTELFDLPKGSLKRKLTQWAKSIN